MEGGHIHTTYATHTLFKKCWYHFTQRRFSSFLSQHYLINVRVHNRLVYNTRICDDVYVYIQSVVEV